MVWRPLSVLPAGKKKHSKRYTNKHSVSRSGTRSSRTSDFSRYSRIPLLSMLPSCGPFSRNGRQAKKKFWRSVFLCVLWLLGELDMFSTLLVTQESQSSLSWPWLGMLHSQPLIFPTLRLSRQTTTLDTCTWPWRETLNSLNFHRHQLM